MEIELGKKYIIKAYAHVYSIDLQKEICFCDDVVVIPEHTHLNQIYFGRIINTSPYGSDYETDNEIEFGPDDVRCEYVKQETGYNYLNSIIKFTDFF